jgi:hypothetical protein
MLTLVECSVDGLIVRVTVLDPDDLDAACAALDARYVVLGGPPLGDVLTPAFGARDWDTVGALFAPECSIVDRRTAGWGSVDPPTFVDYMRELVELAPDARWFTDHARSRGRVHLSTGRVFGTHDGGPWEMAFVTVAVTRPDGRGTHIETYELDEMETALRRFDELTGSSPTSIPANAAARFPERAQACFNARDWEGARSLLAADFVFEDRRAHARLRGGADMWIAAARELPEDLHTESEVLATFGCRVAVLGQLHTLGAADAASVVEVVRVIALDTDGRLQASINFDPGDRAAAVEAAARCFGAGEGAGSHAALEVIWELGRAINRGDFAAALELCHDDFAAVDHRRLGLLSFDSREVFVESLRAVADLAPGSGLDFVRLLAWDAHGIVTVGRRAGTDREGGTFESLMILLETVEAGRVTRIEYYEVEDSNRALARFEELRPRLASTRARLPLAPNRAARVVAEAGWTLLSMLDDDLCLHETASGFLLHEVDASGVVIGRTEYAADEQRAAADEIARRLSDRSGFPAPASQMPFAINAHDLDAVRACFADACVFEDHRGLRVIEFGDADQYVDLIRAAMDLAPDYTVMVRRVYAVEPRGHVILTGSLGTLADGGCFEITVAALTLFDDTGHVTRIEIYEPDDVDAAVARLRELAP